MGMREFILEIASDLLRYGDNKLMMRLRYIYYKKRFKSCGDNVLIYFGVIIQDPENIQVGNNVGIQPYTFIQGRGVGNRKQCYDRQ